MIHRRMINGQMVRVLRTTRGLTRTDLASRLGVSYATLRAWEAGLNTPNLRNVKALSEALSVSPEDLYLTSCPCCGAPVTAAKD